MWDRTFLRFTLVEWLVAVIFLLVLARLFFAKELVEFEDSVFGSIGLGGGGKYLVTVPLAAWVMYRIYKREKAHAVESGAKVVRPQVIAVAIGLLILAIGALFLTTA
jgi:putative copper export protein